MSRFTTWLADPPAGRGVRLARDDGGWSFISYSTLAALARRSGAALAAAGVRPGDAVCIPMPTGLDLLSVYFGAWLVGAVPCAVAPPVFQSAAEYAVQSAGILSQAAPRLVVTTAAYAEPVAAAMREAGRTDAPWIAPDGGPADESGSAAEAGTEPRAPSAGSALALLQFTSGSTGVARGVRVSWTNLEADVALIRTLLGIEDGEALASWLPLHHDMGLSVLLTAVYCRSDLWLMRPEQFVRRPVQWLSCFEPGRARHCASPSFGFAYTNRRVTPEQFAALDLTQWRTALVGAEAVDPATLQTFARLAAPAGFRARVFRPAYGLAEATVAVTAAHDGAGVRLVRVAGESLVLGRRVSLLDEAVLDDEGRARAVAARHGQVPEVPGDRLLEASEGWLAGHSSPPPEHGVRVSVLDEAGEPLADGALGEIAVDGPIVTDGYHAGRVGGTTRLAGDRLLTGDAGFIHAGDLFVLGRMGDVLKVNGRSVFMEDLDAKVSTATGLDRSRVAVVGRYLPGAPGSVAVFAETREDAAWARTARQALRPAVGADCAIKVIFGNRGLIKRTSSGKPRRRYLWALLQTGQWPWAEPSADPVVLADMPMPSRGSGSFHAVV